MFKFFKKAQDQLSSYTHYLGAVLGVFYLFSLQIIAFLHQKSPLIHISLLIFAISVIALYSSSSYYHYISDDAKHKTLFRKLDHSMIYVLIAGTYTPICIAFLSNDSRLIFTAGIWAIALLGIITKIIWLNAPRLLYTLLYLCMGWAIVFDIQGFASMPSQALLILALGGLSYSVGALIYIFKKPNLSKLWGFHELFHIFILLGTLLHFIAIALYIA